MSSVPTSKILFIILIDSVKSFLYCPVWWYSRGFIKIIKDSKQLINELNLTIGFSIWLKNLFIPMFGMRAWQDRLISLFIRLVQIIFRGILFLICVIIIFLFNIVWAIAPFFILWQILVNVF